MTSRISEVASQAQSTPLAPRNTAAVERIVLNGSSGVLYVAYDNNASPNFYTAKLNPGDSLATSFNGSINGCWAAPGLGNALVTETA